MLEVIFSWIYLGVICSLIGFGMWKLLMKITKLQTPSFVNCIVTGIVCITVYTEYLSIVYKIALLAQVIVIAAALLIIVFYRKELLTGISRKVKTAISWEGFFISCSYYSLHFLHQEEISTRIPISIMPQISVFMRKSD